MTIADRNNYGALAKERERERGREGEAAEMNGKRGDANADEKEPEARALGNPDDAERRG